MKSSKRGIGRIALYAGVTAALCVPVLPATSHSAAAQGSSRTINGHAVSGRFLEVWSSQGSEQNNVYVNGLPITDAPRRYLSPTARPTPPSGLSAPATRPTLKTRPRMMCSLVCSAYR
jgi:hypothetical protein